MGYPAERTAVLLHLTRSGSHYDWLMGNPHEPGGDLWAARLEVGPWGWRAVERFGIEPIAPHRRLYLDYEGPLGQGRGRVQRVDWGQVEPVVWEPERIEVRVSMQRFEGAVRVRRRAGGHWEGQVLD